MFEVIGLDDTIEQALAMTWRGGQAMIVGVPRWTRSRRTRSRWTCSSTRSRSAGAWYGSSNVHRDVPRLVALYKDGTLKLDELVSRTIGLEGINYVFGAMEAGEVARSVVDYGI